MPPDASEVLAIFFSRAAKAKTRACKIPDDEIHAGGYAWRIMETGFFGKIVISVVAGFAAACLIQFYVTFIQGADKALNEGHQARNFVPD